MTKVIPDLEKKLKEAIGASITYDVDWKRIAAQPHALDPIRGTLVQINEALLHIAKEPLAKETIAKKLKTIRLEHGNNWDRLRNPRSTLVLSLENFHPAILVGTTV